jgi:hypothetical protein
MTIAERIAAKVNAQTEEQAAPIYSGLRLIVMRARAQKQHAPEGAAMAMKLAGDALEARIGERRFDHLIDQIDAHVFG